MPYNPGIQDISGQLLAQGMQARAQGIAGGVTTLFQGLQQNQMMTNQAIARFQAATAANPKLLDFLNKAGSEESPIPVNPDVIKAYSDIKSGKANVQNTALLAQFADSYNQAEAAQQQQQFRQAQMQSMASENQLRQAQTLKALAELQGVGVPRGQVMTLEQFRGLPQDVDAKAEPIPGNPNLVAVTGYNLRGPSQGKVTPVDVGSEIHLLDEKGALIRSIPKTGALPPGYEAVAGGGAPSAAGTTQAPESLVMFRPSATMAPPSSLLQPGIAPAQQGVTPATAQAIRAITPAATSAQTYGGTTVRPMRGSPQEAELIAKQAEEARTQERKIESADAILGTIQTLKPKISMTSVGPGAYTKGIKGTPAKDVEALLKNIQAKVAFNELRALKEDKTSLGQVAIKEIELLQNAITALDQDMSPELFSSQLDDLENKIRAGRERLLALESDRRAGLKAPSNTFYRLGGKTVDDYNRQEAAATAIQDPLKALEAAGWGIKR